MRGRAADPSRHLLRRPDEFNERLLKRKAVPIVVAAPPRRLSQRPTQRTARLPCVMTVELEPFDLPVSRRADPRTAAPDIIEVGPGVETARHRKAGLSRFVGDRIAWIRPVIEDRRLEDRAHGSEPLRERKRLPDAAIVFTGESNDEIEDGAQVMATTHFRRFNDLLET